MKASALACAVAITLAGCTSAPAHNQPTRVVAAFVETWADPSRPKFAERSYGDLEELAAAITSLSAQGVTRFSVRSLRSIPKKRGQVSGFLRLHFEDGALLEAGMRATVKGSRVRASPSLLSDRLLSWEPMVVEEFGSPVPGSLVSRIGTALTTGDSDGRAVTADLETAVALMERALASRLAGRMGRVLVAGADKKELARASPRDGEVVTTSLDDEIQARAAETLGDRPGAMVVVDPLDGGIRALVSNPHPEAPGISAAAHAHLPGSSFKIVTAVAAARAGVLRPSQMIDCPAQVIIGNATIRNFEGDVGGRITMRDALARSCNTAFARIGSTLGFQRIAGAARDLGIDGSPTAGAAPSLVSIPETQAEVATLAIGASTVSATPVAMAGVAATVAREGIRIRPNWGGSTQDRVRVFEAKAARDLLGMMEEVIESGTGRLAAIPGAKLAGKTGTAEVRGPDGRVEATDAWFLAIAPSRGARMVVVCQLPRGGVGGRVAAPLVRAFLLSVREVWEKR